MAQHNNIEDLVDKFHPSRMNPQIDYYAYLDKVSKEPHLWLRNIFQLFHDMVHSLVPEGVDEYPDSESISYLDYNFCKLTTKGVDTPFITDRIFANRFMKMVDSFRRGSKQNQMYIIEGPHGCGKSLFLNNVVQKLQEFTKTQEGMFYETSWVLDTAKLGTQKTYEISRNVMDKVFDKIGIEQPLITPKDTDRYIKIPCPSHDHPILQIPKKIRKDILERLIIEPEFKDALFNDRQYDWVLKDEPCTICTEVYHELLNQLGSSKEVLRMIQPRPYIFNRRLSQGINIMNPGDSMLDHFHHDKNKKMHLQKIIDEMFPLDHNIQYIYSPLANTNNGVYVLMDNKKKNVERFIELHGILSERLHKVEMVEEYITSLFICIMNPEDRKNIANMQSFKDRTDIIKMGYILDYKAEVQVYKNQFGAICNRFLPEVLENFGKVVVSSRLKSNSKTIDEWIRRPRKYAQYMDKNKLLLKMDLYAGHIPTWLTQKDFKRLNNKRRKEVIDESENEGDIGISGRDSIRIFSDFFAHYSDKEKLISMNEVVNFFKRKNGKLSKDLAKAIPTEFLDSLVDLYDYEVLQHVKKSLFASSEKDIRQTIEDYIFSINYDIGAEVTNPRTDNLLKISDKLFNDLEEKMLGKTTSNEQLKFRESSLKEYQSHTLTIEMNIEEKDLQETQLFNTIYDRYTYTLKEKVLDGFRDNKGKLDKFRQAVKDYSTKDFNVHEKRVQKRVTGMIENMIEEFKYTQEGARQASIYILDKNN